MKVSHSLVTNSLTQAWLSKIYPSSQVAHKEFLVVAQFSSPGRSTLKVSAWLKSEVVSKIANAY